MFEQAFGADRLYAEHILEVKYWLVESGSVRGEIERPQPVVAGCGRVLKGSAFILLNLDIDLSRLGFFFLRKSQSQHAVLELSVDRLRIHVRRKCERAIELPVASLDSMIVLTLLFVFDAPLAGNREGILV